MLVAENYYIFYFSNIIRQIYLFTSVYTLTNMQVLSNSRLPQILFQRLRSQPSRKITTPQEPLTCILLSAARRRCYFATGGDFKGNLRRQRAPLLSAIYCRIFLEELYLCQLRHPLLQYPSPIIKLLSFQMLTTSHTLVKT